VTIKSFFYQCRLHFLLILLPVFLGNVFVNASAFLWFVLSSDLSKFVVKLVADLLSRTHRHISKVNLFKLYFKCLFRIVFPLLIFNLVKFCPFYFSNAFQTNQRIVTGWLCFNSYCLHHINVINIDMIKD
jgi:hypothetical protein